jgi:KUP system potassium uptake protein
MMTHPGVLVALDPREGLEVLFGAGWGGWALVGAVVLAITGAEALYADLGHFGRQPILRAWRLIVFPALILNYLGQAALVLESPANAQEGNLFFLLAPPGPGRMALVVLATVATVIASQALISAVFSLASQAIDLGFLPRFFVQHTSSKMRGQLYVPLVNGILATVCLLLVLVFRSSEALANAYGIAVTAAMAVTSMTFVAVCWAQGKIPRWQCVLLLVGLLLLDFSLFGACLTKLFEGGLVPVILATGVSAIMLTWHRGRRLIDRAMRVGSVSVEELGRQLASGEFQRVEGAQVFVVRRPALELGVAAVFEHHRRSKVLAERIIILLLDPRWSEPTALLGRVEVASHGGGLSVVRARHGYMVEPDVPACLRLAVQQSPELAPLDLTETFFIIARPFIVSCPEKLMRAWQRHLFAFMTRNVIPGPHYLQIPPEQLVFSVWLLRL